MKLKYYLRGLGIGIVVTALLMGYSNKNHAAGQTQGAEVQTEEDLQSGLLSERNGEDAEQSLTEETTAQEPIILRNETAEAITEETETTTEEVFAQDSDIEQDMTTEDEINETEESSEPAVVGEEDIPEQPLQTLPEADMDDLDDTDSVALSIVHGDDSGTVSRKLQNAGLISDASEFDAYLMQHGYDKKISVGTVEIPKDATWVQIAELISARH